MKVEHLTYCAVACTKVMQEAVDSMVFILFQGRKSTQSTSYVIVVPMTVCHYIKLHRKLKRYYYKNESTKIV